MDEQIQARRIKRRRSQAEIEQLIAEYDASSLSRTAFCQQRGLSLSTLSRYRRRQGQKTGETAKGKRWLAVEVSGSATGAGGGLGSGLAVVLAGGWRIEIGCGFDGETLTRLLVSCPG